MRRLDFKLANTGATDIIAVISQCSAGKLFTLQCKIVMVHEWIILAEQMM